MTSAALTDLMPLVSSHYAAIHFRVGYYVFYKPDGSLWVLDIDARPNVVE